MEDMVGVGWSDIMGNHIMGYYAEAQSKQIFFWGGGGAAKSYFKGSQLIKITL